MPLNLVTTDDLNKAIATLNTRINLMAEASQQDIDNLTAEVSQVASDLQDAQSKLQAEIDKLAQANPGVDVTALKAAVDPLDAAVVALGNLQPSPPAA